MVTDTQRKTKHFLGLETESSGEKTGQSSSDTRFLPTPSPWTQGPMRGSFKNTKVGFSSPGNMWLFSHFHRWRFRRWKFFLKMPDFQKSFIPYRFTKRKEDQGLRKISRHKGIFKPYRNHPLYIEIFTPPQEIGSAGMTQGSLGLADKEAACGNGKDHSPLQQRTVKLKGHFEPTALQPV